MSLTRSIVVVFALSIVVDANFLAAMGGGVDLLILSAGTLFAALSFEAIEPQEAEVVSFWGAWDKLKKLKELKDQIKDPWGKL